MVIEFQNKYQNRIKMPTRRNTKVTLNLDDVATLFQQQTTLLVKDALGIIDEAQDLMSEEPNMVQVQAPTIYGKVLINCRMCRTYFNSYYRSLWRYTWTIL